ncbi:hypothetical protein ACV229_30750 [Burkholderia sp. MR1-5-21]
MADKMRNPYLRAAAVSAGMIAAHAYAQSTVTLYGIVYTVASYGHATGENGAGSAQAVIGSMDIDAGKRSQAIVTVGLRHRF